MDSKKQKGESKKQPDFSDLKVLSSRSTKRGPYRATKAKKIERPANYFREEHEGQSRFISWTDVAPRGGHIYVQYKFHDDRAQYRSPRYKTVWLDALGLEHAKAVVEAWKNANNNSIGLGDLLPQFYLQHRKDFIQYLYKTARHSTIENYDSSLRRHVFPYLVGKLRLDHPKQWDAEAVHRWQVFLSSCLPNSGSQNRIKVAFRRYMKFLLKKGLISFLPTVINDPEVRDSRETPIPGDLPEWKDLVAYFRKIPPGKIRFVKAVEAAFGVRISEALSVDPSDFFGEESEQFIISKNDHVKRVHEDGLAALFLNIDLAKKRPISKDIIRMIGEDPDDDPKTGNYTACCTNWEMADLILEMLNNGEHEGEIRYDDVNKYRKDLPIDSSSLRFHEYRDHDYRRLNITLQALDFVGLDNRIDICCEFHGQRSYQTFKRYFQWGLTQRRKQKRDPQAQLKVLPKKKATQP